MRVLLADDAKDMLILTSAILRKAGHEVVTATDGREAWEILLAEPDIQIVISDWMMPEMDGLELCRQIRSDRLPRYIYVILLTGRSDRESLLEGMEAGADDFLTKPVNHAELRVRVRAGERIIALEASLEERNRRIKTAHAKLSDGALVLAHNSINAAERLKHYLAFVRDSDQITASVNVVFDIEGLEVSVK